MESFKWKLDAISTSSPLPKRTFSIDELPLSSAVLPETVRDSPSLNGDLSPAIQMYVFFYEGLSSLGGESRPCARFLLFASMILYPLALVSCVAVVAFWAMDRDLLVISNIDWFGWIVFGAFCVTELLLFVSRLLARWDFLGPNSQRVVERSNSLSALWGMIINRDAFGGWHQAFIVIVFQMVGSGCFSLAILVLMSQMLDDELDPNISMVYTSLYIFLVFSLCVTGVSDSLRITEYTLEENMGWSVALELTAWRVLILITVCPWLWGGFGFYSNICCAGDFRWRM